MPVLHQAQALDSLLPSALSRWLVLDRLPDTLKRLYDLEEMPVYVPLYARTRFAGSLAQSPLLVSVSDPLAPLWQAFVEGQGESPLRGVIITSHAPQAEVVAHLRARLEIRFYGQRQGLLRFYDPWIAAHLFSSAAASRHWLGPLERVVWHGGTFEQRAEAGSQWYAFAAAEPDAPAPSLAMLPDDKPLALAPEQEAAMERYAMRWPLWRQQVERHGLDENVQVHAQRFVSACLEAEHLALPHSQWADYLAWRFAAPDAAWPEGILDMPVASRLAHLQRQTELAQTSATTQEANGTRHSTDALAKNEDDEVLALLAGTHARERG